jgi:uncharacterized membrane protein YedE/YeeE
MAAFDPASALLGGALIGLAAVLLMMLSGRIAGVSGVLGGLLTAPASDRSWRIAFIAGLIAVPLIAALFGRPLAKPVMPGWLVIVAGGLLVGFGTRYGSGCTSGHGVCGISRLSLRSIVATCVFMATAAITVAAVRHGIGG